MSHMIQRRNNNNNEIYNLLCNIRLLWNVYNTPETAFILKGGYRKSGSCYDSHDSTARAKNKVKYIYLFLLAKWRLKDYFLIYFLGHSSEQNNKIYHLIIHYSFIM